MSVTHKAARWKQNSLILLFGLIIITAHPVGPLYPVATVVWPALHLTGLNVFMKPFTADMVFMYDGELKKSLYKYDLSVTYYSKSGPLEVPVQDLSFHRWRVPFTWLGIAAMNGEDPTAYIQTLCAELERSYGSGKGFRINSNAPEDVANKYGMNTLLTCYGSPETNQ